LAVFVCCAVLICASAVLAQDWPQWRGANRDAKVDGFKAPASWPGKLTQAWKITVGVDSCATPALVGDKLYVFTRQDANEVILCLNAATGKELWRDGYVAVTVTGAPASHPGPRSSPAVVNGKVVTFGVGGVLSCWDTNSHKLLWRKDEFQGVWPQFYTGMSPVITDGLCIGHFGGPNNTAVVAYDMTTGNRKWAWPSPAGPSYASPNIMTVSNTKMVVVMTETNIVGLKIADGTLQWEIPYAGSGMSGMNTCTPIVDGATIYYGGSTRGISASTIKKDGDKFVVAELWPANMDNSTQYNTPVLKNGLLYGLSQSGSYFCVDAKTGKTAWTQSASTSTPASGGRAMGLLNSPGDNFVIVPAAMGGGGGRGGMGGGGGGGRGGMGGGRGGGGMGGGGGFGSIVDAGSFLIGLTSPGKMVIFQPSDKEYKELAGYQVTEGNAQVYAYPVVSGNRIYIRDQTTLALWTIE
jgi:outer membrane protein assembly factor BamB